jgi:hypothetical protein
VDLFEELEGKSCLDYRRTGDTAKRSGKTLYKQAARGKLPSFRIGTCVRVHGKAFADRLRGKIK